MKRKPINDRHDAIAAAIRKLSEDYLDQLTGKSRSLRYKWGDQDSIHEVPFFQAQNLDRALVEAGHAPAFLTALAESSGLEVTWKHKEPANIEVEASEILHAAVHYHKCAAALTTAVEQSRGADSDQGAYISPTEQREINEAQVQALEANAALVRLCSGAQKPLRVVPSEAAE